MTKRRIILAIVLIVATVVVAQPLRPRKWQDFVDKPNHAWLSRFGYSDGSQLAAHVFILIENDKALDSKIASLEKQVAELKKTLNTALEIMEYKPNGGSMKDIVEKNMADPNAAATNEDESENDKVN